MPCETCHRLAKLFPHNYHWLSNRAARQAQSTALTDRLSMPYGSLQQGREQYMDSIRDVFKHNKARKNVIIGGMLILICITALSCVSSFMIYRGGFADLPYIFQQALALFAVIVVEGAFVWLL